MKMRRKFKYTKIIITCALLFLCLKPILSAILWKYFSSSKSDSYTFPFFVSRLEHVPDYISSTTKIFAFYLPQFHSFEENDKFWGQGFTEWTNVRSARPLFKGHYQPHKPIGQGYYDLNNVTVMKEQVKLARKYGINGFVFYFYWFHGRVLMEGPIKRFAESKDIDFPFCLCWANENWTRTWDGLDKQVLVKQSYSDEDDINFIKYISYYMKKSNYIRINNRPLIMIYAPNYLPNAKKTFSDWRKWCRENMIGEIYIANVQGPNFLDQNLYGLDAAIEFPPRHFSTRRIFLNEKRHNCARLYNYASFQKRTDAQYKVFSGITPSWDNTPRRKCGAVWVNSSPHLYQQWLSRELKATSIKFSEGSEKLVFINAWNEWGEGAHLEPDERYGYAYLEATRMALIQYDLQTRAKSSVVKKISNVAFFVHAFYMDVFSEILEYVLIIKKLTDFRIKLYVAAFSEIEQQIRDLLQDSSINHVVNAVNNRGRDVLPFLLMLPQLIKNNDIIVKLHTKKTLFRPHPFGEAWRTWILESLISLENFQKAVHKLEKNPALGIVYPKGSTVPIRHMIGSNRILFSQLAMRLGYDPQVALYNSYFCAGNMFIARTQALIPLENLAFSNSSFEYEVGQIDGTLAHAIERVIGLSVKKSGFTYTE